MLKKSFLPQLFFSNWIGLLVFLLWGNSVVAQIGPVNDDFSDRITLNGNQGTVRMNSTGASAEVGEPNHAGENSTASVWWTWQAPAEGDQVAIFSTEGSTFDTILAVYTGSSLQQLVTIASNDDAEGVYSRVSFRFEPSKTYQIVIDGYEGETGDARLSWSIIESVAHDNFSEGHILEGEAGSYSTSNVGASREPGEPNHVGESATYSTWYRWQAPEVGRGIVEFSTQGSSFDTLMAAYTGNTLENLQVVASNDDDELLLTSRISFFFEPGQLYHVVVDGYSGASGDITFNWGVYSSTQNDKFQDRIPLNPDGGSLRLGFVDATSEPQEPDHGNSLWWSWQAPFDGLCFINSMGSTVDTRILIYRGSQLANLELVEENDDISFEDTSSSVFFEAKQGERFQIAITSGDGAGLLQLTWGVLQSCGSPPVPSQPVPADGQMRVRLDVSLQWGTGLFLNQRIDKTIYGEDDRLDLYQIDDPALIALARSTVALTDIDSLGDIGDGKHTFFNPSIFRADQNLCEGEPFGGQPVPAWCSGFLVGPDLVLTAGHCLSTNSECSETAFVFDFEMLDEKNARMSFEDNQVYYCQGVIAFEFTDSGADWALIQLDRAVEGRTPLKIRREGSIAVNDEVFVIGYPSGLPVKIADGANVRSIEDIKTHFVTNLDVYGGNSGSAVFNKETLEVEGILVRGEQDFKQEGICHVSVVCEDDGCRGEDVSTITRLQSLIPPLSESVSFEIEFGPCDSEERIREVLDSPEWQPQGLDPGREYCWKVITNSECGTTEGPEWRFTTDITKPRFLRGDCNSDGDTGGVTDAIFHLEYSFLGSVTPECLAACDMNADGDSDGITNAIYLISHNFLGESPPPSPYPNCGEAVFESDLILGCETEPQDCQ